MFIIGLFNVVVREVNNFFCYLMNCFVGIVYSYFKMVGDCMIRFFVCYILKE